MGIYLQIGGEWALKQDNGFEVNLELEQHEDQIPSGAARHSGGAQAVDIKGFVKGPFVQLLIKWDDDTIGQYSGHLMHESWDSYFQGTLRGQTIDLMHHGSTASWYSERTFMFLGSM